MSPRLHRSRRNTAHRPRRLTGAPLPSDDYRGGAWRSARRACVPAGVRAASMDERGCHGSTTWWLRLAWTCTSTDQGQANRSRATVSGTLSGSTHSLPLQPEPDGNGDPHTAPDAVSSWVQLALRLRWSKGPPQVLSHPFLIMETLGAARSRPERPAVQEVCRWMRSTVLS